MGKSLVIVESPAKARTINRFLGKKYQVKASMGHVRDLPKNPKKKGQPDWIGIDEDDDFKPHYIVLRDKKKTVDDILAAAKKAEEVLLAADPDREGEAICWHLEQILKKSNPDATIQRVEFNEAGHSIMIDASAPFAEAVERFLADVSDDGLTNTVP